METQSGVGLLLALVVVVAAPCDSVLLEVQEFPLAFAATNALVAQFLHASSLNGNTFALW